LLTGSLVEFGPRQLLGFVRGLRADARGADKEESLTHLAP
jgi:hypothetical protein